jgi:hypothetical protein
MSNREPIQSSRWLRNEGVFGRIGFDVVENASLQLLKHRSSNSSGPDFEIFEMQDSTIAN